MKTYKVKSESVIGKNYIVRETPTGLRCECPAFVFNDKKPCKHIAKVEELLEKVKELREAITELEGANELR